MPQMLVYEQFYRIRHLQEMIRALYGLRTPHAGLIAIYPDLTILVVLDVLLRSRGYLDVRDRSVLELVVEVLDHLEQCFLCDVVLSHVIASRLTGGFGVSEG